MDKGYCQKDNKEVPLEQGCIHPHDYCQYRTACVIHYLERERKRSDSAGGHAGGRGEGDEGEAEDTHHQ